MKYEKMITVLLFVVLTILLVIFNLNEPEVDYYNLGFELVENDQAIGWDIKRNDSYEVKLDNKVHKEGVNSLSIERIEHDRTQTSKVVTYSLYGNFTGEEVSLSGYMKTQNVNQGAMLFMRVEPEIAIVDLLNGWVKGTTDWQEYNMKLDIKNVVTERIVIGAVLSGGGKIWVDDFDIKIDGKPPQQVPVGVNTQYFQVNYGDFNNLSFEYDREKKPIGWLYHNLPFGNEDYVIGIDEQVAHHGQQSIRIRNINPNYNPENKVTFEDKSWQTVMNYLHKKSIKGNKIKISGHIKTENVENGFAALWVRIEPDLVKDLMMNRGVTGTHDWQKFEIELEYDLAKVERVLFGGWLQGEGTAWFDNFEISFDGKVLKDNKNDVFNNYLNKNKNPPKRW